MSETWPPPIRSARATSQMAALVAAGRFAEAAALPLASPEDRLARARLMARHGREAEAEADLAPLLDHADGPISEPILQAARIERALLDLRRTQPPEAAHQVAETVLGSPDLAPALRARALLLRGLAGHRLDHWQQAERDLVTALDMADGAGDAVGRIDILRALGIVHAWRGRHSQAVLHLTLALADCAALGEAALTADLLGELGRANLEMRRHHHALAFLRREEQIASSWLDVRERIRLHIAIAQALLGAGDPAGARDLLAKAGTTAEQAGFTYLTLVALREEARAHMAMGALDAAATALARARPLAGSDPASYDHLSLDAVAAELAARRGEAHAAAALAQVVAELATRDLIAHEIDLRLVEGALLARSGAAGAASVTLRAALERARARGLDLLVTRVQETMARFDLPEGLARETDRPVSTSFETADTGYVLLEPVGQGSFGTVFHAYDLERGRDVALKRMTGFDRYDGQARASLLASARTELESAARVSHPGVARVLALGDSPQAGVYVVQDFISGPSLRHYMGARPASDPTPPITFIPVMRRLALALAALHEAGVVHRDIKPENILCPAPDRPVIVDLGLAADLARPWLTKGRGTGTYAAPEQWMGSDAQPYSDLYAFGVIAFEWLVGRRPEHAARSGFSFFQRRARLSPADAAALQAVAPPALARLIEELLAEDPQRRPQMASTVAKRLRDLSSHDEA